MTVVVAYGTVCRRCGTVTGADRVGMTLYSAGVNDALCAVPVSTGDPDVRTSHELRIVPVVVPIP